MPIGRRLWQAVLVLCLVLTVALQVKLVQADFLTLVPNAIHLSDKDLPETVEGWEKSAFEVVHRSRVNSLGSESCIWRFQSPNGPVQVAFDGPFLGWHELSRCYEHQGWEIENRQVIASNDGAIVKVEMKQSWGEHALLFFCILDDAGTLLEPPGDFGTGENVVIQRSRRTGRFFKQTFGSQNKSLSRSQSNTNYQVQTFVSSSTPFSESGALAIESAYRQFLVTFRQLVRKSGAEE